MRLGSILKFLRVNFKTSKTILLTQFAKVRWVRTPSASGSTTAVPAAGVVTHGSDQNVAFVIGVFGKSWISQDLTRTPVQPMKGNN